MEPRTEDESDQNVAQDDVTEATSVDDVEELHSRYFYFTAYLETLVFVY